MLLKPKLPKQKQFKLGGSHISNIESVSLIGLVSKKARFWQKWVTYTSPECFQGDVAFYVRLELDGFNRTSWAHHYVNLATRDGEKYWQIISDADLIRKRTHEHFRLLMSHMRARPSVMAQGYPQWRSRLARLDLGERTGIIIKPKWAYDISDKNGEVKEAISRYSASITL
jgi:hypothetical protein